MSNCCNCTYKIEGCFNACGPIQLALLGIEDCTYVVSGGYYSFEAEAESGVLTIPANALNEDACTTISIEGYELVLDDKIYNCFQIKTNFSPIITNS